MSTELGTSPSIKLVPLLHARQLLSKSRTDYDPDKSVFKGLHAPVVWSDKNLFILSVSLVQSDKGPLPELLACIL